MALECRVPLVFLGPFWFLLGFLPVVSLFGFSLPLSTAILNTYKVKKERARTGNRTADLSSVDVFDSPLDNIATCVRYVLSK